MPISRRLFLASASSVPLLPVACAAKPAAVAPGGRVPTFTVEYDIQRDCVGLYETFAGEIVPGGRLLAPINLRGLELAGVKLEHGKRYTEAEWESICGTVRRIRSADVSADHARRHFDRD